jgi:hypothetical protein
LRQPPGRQTGAPRLQRIAQRGATVGRPAAFTQPGSLGGSEGETCRYPVEPRRAAISPTSSSSHKDEIHWVVEVKMDEEMEFENVQRKA